MDILIIESFSWNPHIETAGEIAIIKTSEGLKTGFYFIDVDNPDDCRFTHINWFKKRFFIKKRKRIAQLQNILERFGVIFFSENPLFEGVTLEIDSFSQNFPTTLEKLKEYKYKNAELGLATVSSLITKTGALNPDPNQYLTLIKRYLYSSATVYERSLLLLSTCKPSKIISFNGRFACAKAIFEAAKHLHIDIEYHERGATQNQYEVFQKQPHDFNYIRHQIKRYWQLADVGKEEIAHNFYKRRRQGDGIGWKSFIQHQQKGLVPKPLVKYRQIVYCSSSDDEFAAVGDLVQNPLFQSQRDAIQFLINWVIKQDSCHLTIRVHPHLQQKSIIDRKWWNSLEGKNVSVITSDSEVDSYALIESADIVLVYNSTIGVEATYWGKPSILLGDSLFSGLGCVYEPKCHTELSTLLGQHKLTTLPQERCLPYGYYFLCRGITYKYYKPEGLFSGTFLNQYLGPEPKYYRLLKSIKQIILGGKT